MQGRWRRKRHKSPSKHRVKRPLHFRRRPKTTHRLLPRRMALETAPPVTPIVRPATCSTSAASHIPPCKPLPTPDAPPGFDNPSVMHPSKTSPPLGGLWSSALNVAAAHHYVIAASRTQEVSPLGSSRVVPPTHTRRARDLTHEPKVDSFMTRQPKRTTAIPTKK